MAALPTRLGEQVQFLIRFLSNDRGSIIRVCHCGGWAWVANEFGWWRCFNHKRCYKFSLAVRTSPLHPQRVFWQVVLLMSPHRLVGEWYQWVSSLTTGSSMVNRRATSRLVSAQVQEVSVDL